MTAPTPEPSPFPVYIVDPAPAWWSAEWWIDAGIPLIGAFGTIIVALAAVYLTWRLARLDRADRARAHRAAFAAAIDAFLQPYPVERPARLLASRDDDRRTSALLTTAAATGQGAAKIASWIFAAEAVNMGRQVDGTYQGDPDPQQVALDRYTLEWVISTRVRQWVETGDMDFSDIDYRAEQTAE